MAQTKRKRKTKHRGNAAGMIESRGRTGRPLSPADRRPGEKGGRKLTPEEKRLARLNRPPSWGAAASRAFFASLVFGLMLLLLFDQELSATIGLTGFMFLMYIPLGYGVDTFVYRRRMKKKAGG